MLTVRRMIVSVLAGAAVAGGVVVATGTPAAAATLPCHYAKSVDTRGPDNTWVTVVVPATDGGNTSCHLQRGYRYHGVFILQETLVHCYGKYVGSNGPDGIFGTNTYNALKEVQRAHGISDDGVYGPWTRDTIYHLGDYQHAPNCYKYNGPGGRP